MKERTGFRRLEELREWEPLGEHVCYDSGVPYVWILAQCECRVARPPRDDEGLSVNCVIMETVDITLPMRYFFQTAQISFASNEERKAQMIPYAWRPIPKILAGIDKRH